VEKWLDADVSFVTQNQRENNVDFADDKTTLVLQCNINAKSTDVKSALFQRCRKDVGTKDVISTSFSDVDMTSFGPSIFTETRPNSPDEWSRGQKAY
jgi:hypothetical protein